MTWKRLHFMHKWGMSSGVSLALLSFLPNPPCVIAWSSILGD